MSADGDGGRVEANESFEDQASEAGEEDFGTARTSRRSFRCHTPHKKLAAVEFAKAKGLHAASKRYKHLKVDRSSIRLWRKQEDKLLAEVRGSSEKPKQPLNDSQQLSRSSCSNSRAMSSRKRHGAVAAEPAKKSKSAKEESGEGSSKAEECKRPSNEPADTAGENVAESGAAEEGVTGDHAERDVSDETAPPPESPSIPADTSSATIGCSKEKGASEEPSSSDDRCSVCLQQIRDLSQLDGCPHAFCYSCILEWMRVKMECPLCKTRIAKVTHNFRQSAEGDDKRLCDEVSASSLAQQFEMERIQAVTAVTDLDSERAEVVRTVRHLQHFLRYFDELTEKTGRKKNRKFSRFESVRATREVLVGWVNRLQLLLDSFDQPRRVVVANATFRAVVYERRLRRVAIVDPFEDRERPPSVSPQFMSDARAAQFPRVGPFVRRELAALSDLPPRLPSTPDQESLLAALAYHSTNRIDAQSEEMDALVERVYDLMCEHHINAPYFSTVLQRERLAPPSRINHFIELLFEFVASFQTLDMFDQNSQYVSENSSRQGPASRRQRIVGNYRDAGEDDVQISGVFGSFRPPHTSDYTRFHHLYRRNPFLSFPIALSAAGLSAGGSLLEGSLRDASLPSTSGLRLQPLLYPNSALPYGRRRAPLLGISPAEVASRLGGAAVPTREVLLSSDSEDGGDAVIAAESDQLRDNTQANVTPRETLSRSTERKRRSSEIVIEDDSDDGVEAIGDANSAATVSGQAEDATHSGGDGRCFTAFSAQPNTSAAVRFTVEDLSSAVAQGRLPSYALHPSALLSRLDELQRGGVLCDATGDGIPRTASTSSQRGLLSAQIEESEMDVDVDSSASSNEDVYMHEGCRLPPPAQGQSAIGAVSDSPEGENTLSGAGTPNARTSDNQLLTSVESSPAKGSAAGTSNESLAEALKSAGLVPLASVPVSAPVAASSSLREDTSTESKNDDDVVIVCEIPPLSRRNWPTVTLEDESETSGRHSSRPAPPPNGVIARRAYSRAPSEGRYLCSEGSSNDSSSSLGFSQMRSHVRFESEGTTSPSGRPRESHRVRPTLWDSPDDANLNATASRLARLRARCRAMLSLHRTPPRRLLPSEMLRDRERHGDATRSAPRRSLSEPLRAGSASEGASLSNDRCTTFGSRASAARDSLEWRRIGDLDWPRRDGSVCEHSTQTAYSAADSCATKGCQTLPFTATDITAPTTATTCAATQTDFVKDDTSSEAYSAGMSTSSKKKKSKKAKHKRRRSGSVDASAEDDRVQRPMYCWKQFRKQCENALSLVSSHKELTNEELRDCWQSCKRLLGEACEQMEVRLEDDHRPESPEMSPSVAVERPVPYNELDLDTYPAQRDRREEPTVSSVVVVPGAVNGVDKSDDRDARRSSDDRAPSRHWVKLERHDNEEKAYEVRERLNCKGGAELDSQTGTTLIADHKPDDRRSGRGHIKFEESK